MPKCREHNHQGMKYSKINKLKQCKIKTKTNENAVKTLYFPRPEIRQGGG